MHNTIILPLSAALALASLLATAEDQASAGDTQQGKQSFLSAGCHHCHGMVAQGARGPTMAAMKYPYEAFEFLVRKPAGGGMPPYSAAQLPDTELRNIYAYLASLPGPSEDLPDLLR